MILQRNMNAEKSFALTLFIAITLLDPSRTMTVLQEEDRNDAIREIMENPVKFFIAGRLGKQIRDFHIDDQAGDVSNEPPVFADDNEASTVKYPIYEDEIPVEDLTGQLYDDEELPKLSGTKLDKTMKEIEVIEEIKTMGKVETSEEIKLNPEVPITRPNDTVVKSIELHSVEETNSKDLLYHATDDPTVIHIRPHPKTFTVLVKEFHECVSCNAEDEARKHYDQCLQKLSFRNQEIMKSCCNVSFDDNFCLEASFGKINYQTVCKDPKKAQMVGNCFWRQIEDKEANDVKLYRECKLQILDRYCTEKSSSDDNIDNNKENDL